MTQVKEDKVMVLMDGSLKLVTPEGTPVQGLQTPEIPMTEAVEAVAMVGGRLQAFWKHGVQVWALGSDQLLQELETPPSPSICLAPPDLWWWTRAQQTIPLPPATSTSRNESPRGC